MAALSHCCSSGLSLVAESWGCSLVAVRGLLVAVASLAVERDSGVPGSVVVAHGLSCPTWNLPGPGIKPVSPALAGGVLTTRPLGKSRNDLLDKISSTVYD